MDDRMSQVPTRPVPKRPVRVGQFISIRVRVVREDEKHGYEIQPVRPSGLPVTPGVSLYLTREEIQESQV